MRYQKIDIHVMEDEIRDIINRYNKETVERVKKKYVETLEFIEKEKYESEAFSKIFIEIKHKIATIADRVRGFNSSRFEIVNVT